MLWGCGVVWCSGQWTRAVVLLTVVEGVEGAQVALHLETVVVAARLDAKRQKLQSIQ